MIINFSIDLNKSIFLNGFQISDLKSVYVPGWKPASYNFLGEAKPY
jgi:hypothetical protein